MFTRRELATLLAALEFWREEIVLHGDRSARPYFRAIGMRGTRPLTADEITQLGDKLRSLPAAE